MAHVSLGTSCRARYAEHISKYGLLNTAAHTQHIQQSYAHVVVYNILYIIGEGLPPTPAMIANM